MCLSVRYVLIRLLKNKSYSKTQIDNAQKALIKLKNNNNKLPSLNAVNEIIYDF